MLVELSGRFQVLPGRPSVVLDVAHNPQAAAVLAENLANMGFFPDTWAVCGMLADKDIAGSLKHLVPKVDHWLLCDLSGPRGASASHLENALRVAGCTADITCWPDPGAAFACAKERAAEGDRIVVFGSFLTVSDVMQATGRLSQISKIHG